ncbi:UbiH/UbiF/VisC/COQ6 family ubiquinone biosynthesis hydroxylase [Teredinibacter haidensis]|uniref:UbiH/UbiF/VisC/COQ6 family ubiquinone biosynthesis hydroxylase n=1 Tax=Teredinibacter haidensis TaxID=2731755 RepID=UPI0009490067|nr:UbiH/UbiF/VisC/COQ6 family ubiquinone biosynthesis hydroxylase [Teredinibacter haidensis]
MSDQHYDLVIVGGGMVGALLAASIAQHSATAHLNIAVIEARAEPEFFSGEQFDPRVVALSRKSKGLLDSLGVWGAIREARACAYGAMEIWDAEGTGNIQFYASDVHEASLGHIIENSVVVNVLREYLRTQSSVTLLDGWRVTHFEHAENKNTLSICHKTESSATLSCDLVIAADGAHSELREMAGLKTREWDYGHTAIVTTVCTEKPHEYCCWQRFSQQGPIAFLPMQVDSVPPASAHHSSLVWSVKTGIAEELMALEDAKFCQRLGRAFEYRLGAVEHTAKRFAIPLRQRHAVDYICPGLALIGDAAHTIHPLAGQGANLGFYDVQALADEIVRACQRNIPLSEDSILRRFQRARKSHNLSAMLLMEGFKRLFSTDDPAIRWARNVGMSLVNKQALLKRQLAKLASGA